MLRLAAYLLIPIEAFGQLRFPGSGTSASF
jgi:hypothetical protein